MVDFANQGKPVYIWEGVYPDFRSANTDSKGQGFSGEVYRRRSLEAASECLDLLKQTKPIPLFHKQRSTHLPLVVAMMLGKGSEIKVLDFGGGLGIGYMTLMESTQAHLNNIKYTIVEVPEVCESGKKLHGGSIRYISSLSTLSDFDLIHAASSLQYIENWRELVEKFASLNPEFILLSDVFAGNINTYATLQNYYESKIPHWFLNLEELVGVFNMAGYDLLFKSHVSSRRLGIEDVLPMTNFPSHLQIHQSLHLLFKKRDQ
jgi:putative methyltransferase (TIGR04325 family)